MIWITSDLHFNHNKDFVWKKRGFTSVQEMNEEIIKRFNQYVSPTDEVYILGDLCMSANIEDNKRLISRLNGHKYIINGNHDTLNRLVAYESLPNTELVGCATTLNYRGYHIYLSHYPTLTANGDANRPLKSRVINFCGHTHTDDKWSDFDKGLIYHVEVDAHNCYPVMLDIAIDEISRKIDLTT